MTITDIRYLVYGLICAGKTDQEITIALQTRGASYEDLVRYIIEVQE